ncbi:hypothetical protein CBR_g36877 [Chara braunii]|uniref:Uncharacterized protein n=1 Tax=Chara braunii TaxID=69332 RepID=A0A388LM24_CHABU|nr:hypothetical protein CBR_g36877 [Chara braunii]|eukprot:GBG83262.1 hypothetical protein CBR_g36877 [Chara braunii]
MDSTSITVTSSPIVLLKTTSMMAISPSAAARPVITASSAQQGGLLEQADVARGQEEGLPSGVDCADRLICLGALTSRGARGLEEGRGLCAEFVERFHKNGEEVTVIGLTDGDLAAEDVATNANGSCDGNNNNNNDNYTTCKHESCEDIKHGEDSGKGVSAIRLLFFSRSSLAILLLCAVGRDGGRGREGWVMRKMRVWDYGGRVGGGKG